MTYEAKWGHCEILKKFYFGIRNLAAVFLSLGTGASLNSKDWKCYLSISIEEMIGAMKIYELSEGAN